MKIKVEGNFWTTVAEMFGICRQHVGQILLSHVWRHI